MNLLVSKADFNNVVNISVNVKDAHLNVHIANAQSFTLRDWLGVDLYDVIEATPTDARFTDLLPLIKRVLVRLTYANYILESRVTDTQFGGVQKQGEFTQMAEYKQIVRLSETEKERAKAEFENVTKYLNDNSTLFPEWFVNCTSQYKYKYTVIN